jgi:hypothetical protein
LVAERVRVYPLGPTPDAVTATGGGVDRVIVTTQDVDWTSEEWHQFAGGMSLRQFVLTFDTEGVRVYTRLSSA